MGIGYWIGILPTVTCITYVKHITMLKKYFLLIIASGLIITSCGDAENKVDKDNSVDSVNVSDKKKPDTNSAPSGTTRGLDIGTEPDDILMNIDNHLVSKATFTSAGAAGGITNGAVTVENTLPDATIQKAFVEVSILLADGKEYRTDYYTVQNIEPGGKKTVKIPNTTRGNSIVCHIVKLKSMELTKGEMILVGSRYVPN